MRGGPAVRAGQVSVIVTTYEQAGCLARVLEGYIAQEEPPLEVVVGDDGSGPSTREVVEKARAAAPFPILHRWQPDEGNRTARARNLGVAAARGDYLVLADGDCLPTRRFVADHALAARRGSFVQGRRLLVGRSASRTLSVRDLRFAALSRLERQRQLPSAHKLLFRVPGWTSPYRGAAPERVLACNLGLFREDALAVNGFDEGFIGWGGEDEDFAARLLRLGLARREMRFSGLNLHLWHPPGTPGGVEEKRRLLAEAAASGEPFCPRGIVKREGT